MFHAKTARQNRKQSKERMQSNLLIKSPKIRLFNEIPTQQNPLRSGCIKKTQQATNKNGKQRNKKNVTPHKKKTAVGSL